MGAAERTWVLPDEPVPVRLMTTIWADTHGVHDDLTSAGDVDEWLHAVGFGSAGPGATSADLASARRLRAAVRHLAAMVTKDERPLAQHGSPDVDSALRDLNEVVTHRPIPLLELTGGTLREGLSYASSPVAAGLADIAQQSIALLGGPGAAKLRACQAPGCVLFFVKTHPRREWCSIACGNRARAARHYEKVRSPR
ncbi:MULTISPECIES: ABATE domain-containing protein [unclassified Amycolatopsis]|uniref:CGNR zinc finger domain-containing protein n=1 Tax=unclassified Amycolatopsis TaxID=2618356 RepID=UPI001C6A66E9|nr:ABATE domain-containing protein [Amycolatopsis sp. DSM 110486]QYN17689.1 ABATE domain-containing protein [Amycolatopsis sp. DSM 110486]